MTYRFTVRELPKDDEAGWVRISKVGRLKLGSRQGEKVDVRAGEKSVKGLVVHQGLTEDSGGMIARLAPSVVGRLGIQYGDVVEIDAGGLDPKHNIKKGGPEICVLALDCSESMRGTKFQQARNAAVGFLDEKTRMVDGDLVGCVGFDGEAYDIFAPTSDYATARKGLDKLELHLGTDIGKALDLARRLIVAADQRTDKKAKTAGWQRHIILLADGNGNPNSPPVAAAACKDAHIVVDVVGIVDGKLQEGLLRQIAETTGGRYRLVDAKNLADLARLYRRFSRKEE